jgi:hypothetical protein
MLRKFWAGEEGFLVSIEYLIIATLLICATVVGWDAVRSAVVSELADVGQAVGDLNQSYSFSGLAGHHATCAGSVFTDAQDPCDDCVSNTGTDANRCVTICSVAANAHSG